MLEDVCGCVGRCESETNKEAAFCSGIVAQHELLLQKALSAFKEERSTYAHVVLIVYLPQTPLQFNDTVHRFAIIIHVCLPLHDTHPIRYCYPMIHLPLL
jgi:hypothetical protein